MRSYATDARELSSGEAMTATALNERGTDRLLRRRDCLGCGGRLGSSNQSGRCNHCFITWYRAECMSAEESHDVAVQAGKARMAGLSRVEQRELAKKASSYITPAVRAAALRARQLARTPDVVARSEKRMRGAQKKRTPEERSEWARHATAHMSAQERSDSARKAARSFWDSMTPEERSSFRKKNKRNKDITTAPEASMDAPQRR